MFKNTTVYAAGIGIVTTFYFAYFGNILPLLFVLTVLFLVWMFLNHYGNIFGLSVTAKVEGYRLETAIAKQNNFNNYASYVGNDALSRAESELEFTRIASGISLQEANVAMNATKSAHRENILEKFKSVRHRENLLTTRVKATTEAKLQAVEAAANKAIQQQKRLSNQELDRKNEELIQKERQLESAVRNANRNAQHRINLYKTH